jgi:phosphoribosylanthranilate isomerase
MIKPNVKICGLSTRETVAAAVRAGASHIGLVFFPRSPRDVTPVRALELAGHLYKTVLRVGVFVDPDDALLAATAGRGSIDIIQLHGAETPSRVQAVRRHFGLPVWKAIGVGTSSDVRSAAAFEDVADLLLFDAKPPKCPSSEGADLPGGMGLRFDWRLLEGRNGRTPWGVSGGLDAGSVAEALRQLSPNLVDVSSGVEEAPGQKSAAKIEAFIAAARSAHK